MGGEDGKINMAEVAGPKSTIFVTVAITELMTPACTIATPGIIAPNGADSSLPMIQPTSTPNPSTA